MGQYQDSISFKMLPALLERYEPELQISSVIMKPVLDGEHIANHKHPTQPMIDLQ